MRPNKQKYIMIIDHDFTIRHCNTPVPNTCPFSCLESMFMYLSPITASSSPTLHYSPSRSVWSLDPSVGLG